MKKMLYVVGFACLFSANLFATDSTLEHLNKNVETVLAPFQNESTEFKIDVRNLEKDENLVSQLTTKIFYNKKTLNNSLTLTLDNLSYSYNKINAPTVAFKGIILLGNVTRIISQEKINAIIPVAMDAFYEVVSRFTEYEIKAIETSRTKDSNENYIGLSALISVKAKLEQLPDSMKNRVMIKEAVLSLNFNIKSGISIEGYSVYNPAYHQLESNQEMLKQFIEHLLADDINLISDGMRDTYRLFNTVIESILERNDENADFLMNF